MLIGGRNVNDIDDNDSEDVRKKRRLIPLYVLSSLFVLDGSSFMM